jgi:hypothetical protein
VRGWFYAGGIPTEGFMAVDKRVDDYFASLSAPQRALAEGLRRLIKAHKAHVTLGFRRGMQLPSRAGAIDGSGDKIGAPRRALCGRHPGGAEPRTRRPDQAPMKVYALGVVLLMSVLSGCAQPMARPCQAAEQRQFDFWIGRWEVFAPDGKKAGDNQIEIIDGGCALIERWRGNGGFTGTSLNSWDAQTRRWRQHWIDSQGGLLQLAGGLDGASMVLASSGPHPDKPGATLRQRIRWTPLPDGAVRQHWETSADDGATWATAFDGRYVRMK